MISITVVFMHFEACVGELTYVSNCGEAKLLGLEEEHRPQ